MKGEGLRYNEGKTRFDLISPFAEEQLAKALTIGADKYAPRNWESGMSWTGVLGSLLRHIHAYKAGEDYDKESGLLHMAHAMCNVMFLLEYYRLYPQGDDRVQPYLEQPRIGLDIDEVLADWVFAFMRKYSLATRPKWWHFDKEMSEKYEELKNDNDFWLNIPAKINPSVLSFEPACYITARPIPTEVTELWLEKNGFPAMKVYTVKSAEDKWEIYQKEKLDVFIDDSFDGFVNINRNGGCCFLMNAPHNERFDVGYRRVFNVNEVINPTGKRSEEDVPPTGVDRQIDFIRKNIPDSKPESIEKKGNMSGKAKFPKSISTMSKLISEG